MEEKEFRQRVMPLQRLMYSMALRLGLPPDDAADVVQDTQLKLWRSREIIPPESGSLKAYCLVSLRNECVSMMRKRKSTASIEHLVDLPSESDDNPTESRDFQILLEKMINTLPDGQQRVIRLSSFGGFDIQEISDTTGFSPGNVRQLLSRARKRLREMLN